MAGQSLVSVIRAKNGREEFRQLHQGKKMAGQSSASFIRAKKMAGQSPASVK